MPKKPSLTVLADTTVCAIVRDELMNPAGGIKDFIDSTVPFAEQAVIVDTGSVDGTRQALEELQARHRNLSVLDHKFNGYGLSRNVSLKSARTRRVFVLDADERLTARDFSELADFIEANPADGYDLSLLNIYPNGTNQRSHCLHNPRLFCLTNHTRYVKRLWEILYFRESRIQARTLIKHFLPPKSALDLKESEWYLRVESARSYRQLQPSRTPSFQRWKSYNPQRENYR